MKALRASPPAETIAIVGTGLAGLMLAFSLARRNIATTLIGPVLTKPVQGASGDDRTTAILNPGIGLLQNLDIWQFLEKGATPLITMELVDGSRHYVFDAAEINQTEFGYNIGNEALKSVLIAEIKKSRFITWHPAQAISIEKSTRGWALALKSGERVKADLLIGADGGDSPTRKAAGIGVTWKSIDQAALVTVLQSEKTHHNVTLEWFREGGPFTLVPVQKNKFALVWCDTQAALAAKLETPLPDLEKELAELTQNRFGSLAITGKLQLWPVKPMLANAMTGAQCALVGEAAHILPPIGAQGFNITLHDIMALTDILAESRHLGLVAAHAGQLARYERTRMRDVALRYHSVNALNTTLHKGNPALHGLRRLSLQGLQRLGFVKRHIMQLGLRQAA